MTDQELIKALRWCGDGLHGCCIGCPGENTCGAPDGGAKTVLDAADRLEALIAKNVELHEKIDLLMENGCAMRREIQKLVFEKSELDQQIGRLEVQVEHLRAGVQMTVELDPDGNSFRMDFQQPRPNWVSVQERLPGYGQDVLCYRPEMAMKIVVSSYDGYYGEDDNEWYEEWSNFGYDADGNCLITHWMPLPEPPSTEEVE